jgi:DNA-binding NarL/FixJ family response regulator
MTFSDAFMLKLAQRLGWTAKQRIVVTRLLAGASHKQVGARLGIEECTVNTHLKRVYAAAGVQNERELLMKIGDHYRVWIESERQSV